MLTLKQDPTTGDVQLLGLVNADTIPYEDIDELIAALQWLKWDEREQTEERTSSLAESYKEKQFHYGAIFDRSQTKQKHDFINYHTQDMAYDMAKEYGGNVEDYLL